MTPALIDESALPHVRPTPGAVSDGAVALRSATEAVRSAARDAAAAWAGIGSVLSAPVRDGRTPAGDGRRGSDGGRTGLRRWRGRCRARGVRGRGPTVRRRRRALLADVEELRARVALPTRTTWSRTSTAPTTTTSTAEHVACTRGGTRRRRTSRRPFASQVGGGSLLLPGPDGGNVRAPSAHVVDRPASHGGSTTRSPAPDARGARRDGRVLWSTGRPNTRTTHGACSTSRRRPVRAALVVRPRRRRADCPGHRAVGRGRQPGRGALRRPWSGQPTHARGRVAEGAAAREVFLARFRAGEPLLASEVDEYERVLERARGTRSTRQDARGTRATRSAIDRRVDTRRPPWQPWRSETWTLLEHHRRRPRDGHSLPTAGGVDRSAANLRGEQRTAAALLVSRSGRRDGRLDGVRHPRHAAQHGGPGFSQGRRRSCTLRGFFDGASAPVAGRRSARVGGRASYGTTTATLAVARIPVANLTLLASAGSMHACGRARARCTARPRLGLPQSKLDTSPTSDAASSSSRGPVWRRSTAGHGNPFTRTEGRSESSELPPAEPRRPELGRADLLVERRGVGGRRYHGRVVTPRLRQQRCAPWGAREDVGYSIADVSLRTRLHTSLGYTPSGRKIP